MAPFQQQVVAEAHEATPDDSPRATEPNLPHARELPRIGVMWAFGSPVVFVIPRGCPADRPAPVTIGPSWLQRLTGVIVQQVQVNAPFFA